LLALKRSLLNREWILMNVLRALASVSSMCNPLIEDYTEIFYMSGELHALAALTTVPTGWEEPGLRSPYSDWIRARRPRGRSSSPGGVKNFLFFTSSRPALGSTQPPIRSVPRVLPLEVKRPGHEADHSPPVSAEVKKTWIYTSTPPYAFMA
jgi:hypothetical protein